MFLTMTSRRDTVPDENVCRSTVAGNTTHDADGSSGRLEDAAQSRSRLLRERCQVSGDYRAAYTFSSGTFNFAASTTRPNTWTARRLKTEATRTPRRKTLLAAENVGVAVRVPAEPRMWSAAALPGWRTLPVAVRDVAVRVPGGPRSAASRRRLRRWTTNRTRNRTSSAPAPRTRAAGRARAGNVAPRDVGVGRAARRDVAAGARDAGRTFFRRNETSTVFATSLDVFFLTIKNIT